MKNLSTLFLILLISILTQAQNECGFDPMANHFLSIHHSAEHRENTDFQILEEIMNIQQSNRNDEYVIPVVVHIVHNNGNENISDLQAERAIEQLNEAFSNTEDFNTPNGVDVPIRFCLAGTDPEGNFTTGINRVQSDLTSVLIPSQDLELKDLIRWDPEKYLNIWVVESIIREPNSTGVVGYASFPSEHGTDIDGVVCEAEFFGIEGGYSKVHIHEVGHYLGLYHTFQNGCPNDDCQTSGDWVCDTPPDQNTFTVFCFDGTNSCSTDEDDSSENNPFRSTELGGLGDQVDMQNNHMDYSNLLCFTRFTEGQSERMQAALLAVRSSLLEGDRCSSPCESPISASIDFESLETEVGGILEFNALGTGFDQAEWFIDGISVAEGSSFQYNAEEEGSFELTVVLSNADIGCDLEFEYELIVNCGVSAFFETGGSTWPIGITLNYLNSDPNVTSWNWTIDGENVSSSAEFEYEFNESGVFNIQLVVSNGLCSDGYSFNVAIGNCITGREANNWYWLNSSGLAFGFDFNEGEDLLISEQPIIGSQVAHNKSTFSDAAGNTRYISIGTEVLDANFQPLQNGTGLSSNISAHYGSIFIRKPGSQNEVYLFTTSSIEDGFADGIRYNLIDDNLNGGLGGVVEGQKDIFIGNCGIENALTVRHCNLVDFWLLYYDGITGMVNAQLFTEDGITGDPVVSDVPDVTSENFQGMEFVVNGAGDRIQHLGETYDFDSSTDELTQINQMELSPIFNSAWTESGRYVYFWQGSTEIKLYRLDTFLPVDEWNENLELVADVSVFDWGRGLSLGPDGNLYTESGFSGYIGRIDNPDAALGEVVFDPQVLFHESFINGFQNNHHAYIYGPRLFLEGEPEVCADEQGQYQVFRPDCITAPIEWTVSGPALLSDVSNGVVNLDFQGAGQVSLVARVELACGLIQDSLSITVTQLPVIDLGPDLSICEGESYSFLAEGDFDSYLWSTGSEEASIAVSSPGIYSVEVSQDNCSATDSAEVLGFINPSIDLGPDLEICQEIVVLNAGNDFQDYVWQDGFPGNSYTVYEGGLYWVTATQPCFASDSILVTDCGEVITSVDDFTSSEDLLWPNPANEQVRLNLGQPTDQLMVYDSRGKLVWEMGTLARRELVLDTRSWAVGIYQLVLISGGKPRTLKLSLIH